jgi:hypothetical protein
VAFSFRVELLREFAIKSFLAYPGAVEFPHNESIFFNKIANGLFSALDLLEPLMLINMPLNDFFLGIQYVLKPFASTEHITHPHRVKIHAHNPRDLRHILNPNTPSALTQWESQEFDSFHGKGEKVSCGPG